MSDLASGKHKDRNKVIYRLLTMIDFMATKRLPLPTVDIATEIESRGFPCHVRTVTRDLIAMQEMGLVDRHYRPNGSGKPAHLWKLRLDKTEGLQRAAIQLEAD